MNRVAEGPQRPQALGRPPEVWDSGRWLGKAPWRSGVHAEDTPCALEEDKDRLNVGARGSDQASPGLLQIQACGRREPLKGFRRRGGVAQSGEL